eukprot:15427398-Alexandrium_andersonii.AAC.1
MWLKLGRAPMPSSMRLQSLRPGILKRWKPPSRNGPTWPSPSSAALRTTPPRLTPECGGLQL